MEEFSRLDDQRASARIDSLQRYEYAHSVRHQFIMIRAVHDKRGEFWVRIDRTRTSVDKILGGKLRALSSFDVPAQDLVRRCLILSYSPCADLVFDHIQIKVSGSEGRLLSVNREQDVQCKSLVVFSPNGGMARVPTVRDVSDIMQVVQSVVPNYNLLQVRNNCGHGIQRVLIISCPLSWYRLTVGSRQVWCRRR